MLIEEAEKKYGKDIAMQIWEKFDLSIINVEIDPEGLVIADFEWENIYNRLMPMERFIKL